MEWRIWINWWIIFYIRYSRLFWIYIRKAWAKDTNKIENRIAFTIKTGYYLKLLTPETMELLGTTKSKIRKDENGENVPYLEITEVALIHLMYQMVNY